VRTSSVETASQSAAVCSGGRGEVRRSRAVVAPSVHGPLNEPCSDGAFKAAALGALEALEVGGDDEEGTGCFSLALLADLVVVSLGDRNGVRRRAGKMLSHHATFTHHRIGVVALRVGVVVRHEGRRTRASAPVAGVLLLFGCHHDPPVVLGYI